jgi:APA family basic amino acid/polyamine antiporter
LAALAIGSVIGSGIFAVPGMVAENIGSPLWILSAWAIVGLVALCSALTFAELANQFPQQGGAFIYLRETYGRVPAFLSGWSAFWVGFPAGSAGISMVGARYLTRVLELDASATTPIACAMLLVICGLALLSTRRSFMLNNLFTLVKVVAIALLVALALLAPQVDFSRAWSTSGPPLQGAMVGSAMVAIFWSYAGWQNLVIVAGESVTEALTLTRALIGAIVIVVAVYLFANVGYLAVLPMEQLAGNEQPAADLAEAALGGVGAKVLAALVVVSSLGALLGSFLAGPRFFYAMAQEGLFFSFAGRVSSEGAAPHGGVLVQLMVALVYVITGSFRDIAGYYVAASLLFISLTLSCVFVLRRRHPNRTLPYRVPVYPLVPLLGMSVSLWVLVTEVMRMPERAGIGLVILLAGLPVYALWGQRQPMKKPS